MPQDTQPPTNSRAWWDDYFREKWEANRGREQTRHFMQRLLDSLPEPEAQYLSSRPTEVLDWGCALGEGVELLSRRFPAARVAGLDFSATAIDSAKAAYPGREFLLTEGGTIPRPFDVIFTSNCLEHFEQPLRIVGEHLRSCRKLYVVLVPYDEYPLCEYHRSQFREESFPRRIGSFVRLATRLVDVDPSQWAGKQLLVVYGSDDYLKERSVTGTRDAERQKWERYYATATAGEEDDEDTRAFGQELAARVSELLPAGSRVLEAGCGSGAQGLALARTGRFRMSMLDFSEHALSHARRLFQREGVAADFIEADAFAAGEPEFDLVFNAGVLEHYSFDEQVALLRGMASRSRRYVLVLVPNRLCFWYWLWRVQKAAQGGWPFGKEAPLADLSQLFEAAGLHLAGQTFMGVSWTEGFIRAASGMEESLVNHALEVHRSPLIPDAEKAYLVAGLASVEPEPREPPPPWSRGAFGEDRQATQLTAALADALALRLAAESQLAQFRARAAEFEASSRLLAEQKAGHESQIRERDALVDELRSLIREREAQVDELGRQLEHERALAAHWQAYSRRASEELDREKRETARLTAEVARADGDAEALRDQLAAAQAELRAAQAELRGTQAELRAAQQKREALRSSLSVEQHARQLLESTLSGSYGHVVKRVREVIGSITPAGSTVLVVSKGDEELVRLDQRRGWHFPQDGQANYAGHYPADGREAAQHLEALRAKGAEFLVFPNAAYWWLDHYREFRDHLDGRYARVWADERCIVYRLSESSDDGAPNGQGGAGFWKRFGRLLPGRRRDDEKKVHPDRGAGGNGSGPLQARGGTAVKVAKPQAQVRLSTGTATYDVVCFPIIDWDFRFQRPQHLASCFAAAGHRVFYVSQEFRLSGESYVLKQRRHNVFEVSLRGPKQNVYKQILTPQGAAVLMESLEAMRRDLAIESAVSVVQLPFWWPLARAARESAGWKVVYDCMDHHAGFSTNRGAMLEQEDELLASADLVVASSAPIEREARKRNRNVVLVRNGCEYQHFAAPQPGPPFAKKPGRPVVGYYGAIADWFDTDLVAGLARRRPDWDFVLVGSTFTADVGALSKLPNVSLPGEKPYAQIPRWLCGFDVAILPFKRLPLTEATNPVKAYEILAAGKPLVSVPLPEVAALGDVVRLASDAAEFESQINAALAGDSTASAERRRAFARHNTWQDRFRALEPVLSRLVREDGPQGRALETPGLVSVILPVYNQASLLRDSINSVLAQTYGDFELIVVNDGSKDDVESVLAEFVEHPKVRLLTQHNQKLPKALSNGFEFARGEFWTWTSADNLMEPEQLSKMVEFLRARPDVAMVYADYLAIDDRGQPLRDPTFRPHNRRGPDSPEIHLPRTTAELNTVKDNFIGACFMYRASAGRVLGEYDPFTMGVEDYDYWMRVNDLLRIEHIGTDDLLYRYRVHDNTLNARAAQLKIFDRGFELMEYERRRREFYEKPWTIFADADTARWLKPLAGKNTVNQRQGGAIPAARDEAKVMVVVRAESLPSIAARPPGDKAYVAVWFDADGDARLPYLHRELLGRLADVCLAEDAATADRLDLVFPKVLLARPDEKALRLALAIGNNDVFYRTTRDADGRRRRLPEVFRPTGRKLRVLLQVDDFTQGGLENVVIDIARSLDPGQFEVMLLVLGTQGPAADAARRAGVEILTLPEADRERHYRKLLGDRRVDLVNATYSLFGADVAADLRIPFVQTIQNTYVWLSEAEIERHRRADVFTTCYAAVSHTAAQYADLKVGLPAAKTVVIPNAVDVERLVAVDKAAERARLRREFGFADDDFVFLNVASVHPPKAQRELVRALAQVVRANARAKLVLLGGAMDERYLAGVRREIDDRGLADAVVIPGHRDDVASFYHAADAFVLPSYWEGWSLALNEAVLAGLPVVASDVGGARELLAETGGGRLVQPPFDCVTDLDASSIRRYVEGEHPEYVAQLAEAMRAVMETPVRPVVPPDLRRRLDRRTAYADYARLFRWLVQGGHPAAARPWLRERAEEETAIKPAAPVEQSSPPIERPSAPAEQPAPSETPPVQTVELDYPVRPRCRFGFGRPTHPKLYEILNRGREDYARTLTTFLAFAPQLARVPIHPDPARPATPNWVNGFFPSLDAISLYGLLATRRPTRYFEIGSGNSTKFAARAVGDHALATKIISIDPSPRAEVNGLCERIVRRPLEETDLSLFDELYPGDFLMFDGSHRCFTNSDVTVFFLEVLTRLKPGVLVGVHDVFLPDDYPPPVYTELFYNEQYLLAAQLLAGGPEMQVVLPNAFVYTDPALSSVLNPLYARPPLSQVERNGCMFWFETR